MITLITFFSASSRVVYHQSKVGIILSIYANSMAIAKNIDCRAQRQHHAAARPANEGGRRQRQ